MTRLVLATPVAAEAPHNAPRVQLVPSPDGTVTLVGIAATGDWVLEHRCRASAVDDALVAFLEARVRDQERPDISIMR